VLNRQVKSTVVLNSFQYWTLLSLSYCQLEVSDEAKNAAYYRVTPTTELVCSLYAVYLFFQILLPHWYGVPSGRLPLGFPKDHSGNWVTRLHTKRFVIYNISPSLSLYHYKVELIFRRKFDILIHWLLFWQKPSTLLLKQRTTSCFILINSRTFLVSPTSAWHKGTNSLRQTRDNFGKEQ